MIHRRTIALILLVGLALALAGCFGAAQEQPADEVIRTPRPTFTPTPKQPTPTPVPVTPTAPQGAAPANTGGAASDGQPLQIAADAPIAVVNSDQVNARKRPNITSDNIIRELARGDELKIVGQSADDEWWFVCCVDNGTAWVYYSYVDTTGNVDAVPVTDSEAGPVDATVAQGAAPAAPQAPAPATQPPAPAATAPPAAPPAALPAEAAQPATPAESSAPPDTPADTSPDISPDTSADTSAPTEAPAPADTPAPAFPFNLVAQEQFVETNDLVRIYLYVYQGTTALADYTLRVTKDGAEMPVSGKSIDAAGFTWPVADPRQRFQNMKVEFPGVQAAGKWEVQLVDGSGAPAGPPATFTLVGGEQNRELYVRYEKP